MEYISLIKDIAKKAVADAAQNPGVLYPEWTFSLLANRPLPQVVLDEYNIFTVFHGENHDWYTEFFSGDAAARYLATIIESEIDYAVEQGANREDIVSRLVGFATKQPEQDV